MPPRRRKRPRESTPPEDRKEEQRPAPPPPAPPALVRLLKKDKKVLEYFRALQVNLNYDIEKWKKRSQTYKDELEELRRVQELHKLPVSEPTAEPKSKVQRSDSGRVPSRARGANQQPSKAALATTKEEAVIDDADFDFEISSSSEEQEDGVDDGMRNGEKPKPLPPAVSGKQTASRSYKFNVDDDDDDDDGDSDSEKNENNEGRKAQSDDSSTSSIWDPGLQMLDGKRGMEAGQGSTTQGVEHITKAETVPTRIRVGWKFLRKAEKYLNEIGIVLATAIVVNDLDVDGNDDDDDDNDNSINDNHGADRIDWRIGSSDGDSQNNETSDIVTQKDAKENQAYEHTSYVRRINNAVLGDIVQTIKEWTKLKLAATFPLDYPGTLDGEDGRTEASRLGEPTKQHDRSIQHQYAAFTTSDVIPCFAPVPDRLLGDSEWKDEKEAEQPPTVPQHPAVRGVEILLQALAWIDSFGSVLDEIEIDGDAGEGKNDDGGDGGDSYYAQLVRSEGDKFQNEVDASSPSTKNELSSPKLFVAGMKNRYGMVRRFVKSLEGEICDTWPVQDRFNRKGNPALHHEAKHGDDNINDGNNHDETLVPAKKIPEEKRKLVMDAKNSLRLSTMVDRCILARIVAAIYLHRSDPSSAVKFLFRYILTTVPSLRQEDYPKYPPVQSLLVIETILNTPFQPSNFNSAITRRTFLDFLLDYFLIPNPSRKNGTKHPILNGEIAFRRLFESFQLALATTAAIYRRRMTDEDTRISEPARAEEAAYQRIVKRLNQSGTQLLNIEAKVLDDHSSFFPHIKCGRTLTNYFLEESAIGMGNNKRTSTMLTWILPITLLLQSDGHSLRKCFSERSEAFLSTRSEKELLVLEAYSKAIRQMEIRSVDSYRAVLSSPTTTEVTTVTQSIMKKFVDLIITKRADEYGNKETISLPSLSVILGICHELADGENALRLTHWWLQSTSKEELYENQSPEALEISRLVDYWSSFPMVRVINLERRQDRMASFLSQAMHSGLWVIRGVIPPNRWKSMKQHKNNGNSPRWREMGNHLTSYIGSYAVDGSQESPAQVEQKLMEWLELGGVTNGFVKRELDSLVKPQWRPNDLRAFDIHASDDPELLVPMSPSEKACALSHIATWKGIASSSTANRFTYTGFARGDPMHDPPGNVWKDRMPPCPAALVLEDDAVLVDRFQDRLEQLLEELPRDFHYCALGYAKPKEAPLVDVPGCEHIKLPTMTWYLTGYLLSQAGAQYLLDRLPVVGPIDAWMGQKMILTSNWENEYGHRVGVGDAPQNGSEHARPTLSRKEIRLCVKFRAYCAGIPLCDQKVRTATATGASASHHHKPVQNWRLRDSDIVYSGNVGATSRKRMNYRKSYQ